MKYILACLFGFLLSLNQAGAEPFCDSVLAAIKAGSNNFVDIHGKSVKDYGWESTLKLEDMDYCNIQQQDDTITLEPVPPSLYCRRAEASAFDTFEMKLGSCLGDWKKTSGANKTGRRWMQFSKPGGSTSVRSWQHTFDDAVVISVSKMWSH